MPISFSGNCVSFLFPPFSQLSWLFFQLFYAIYATVVHCHLSNWQSPPLESHCPSGTRGYQSSRMPSRELKYRHTILSVHFWQLHVAAFLPPFRSILACLVHHGVLSSHSGFEIGNPFTCPISFGNISFLLAIIFSLFHVPMA